MLEGTIKYLRDYCLTLVDLSTDWDWAEEREFYSGFFSLEIIFQDRLINFSSTVVDLQNRVFLESGVTLCGSDITLLKRLNI